MWKLWAKTVRWKCDCLSKAGGHSMKEPTKGVSVPVLMGFACTAIGVCGSLQVPWLMVPRYHFQQEVLFPRSHLQRLHRGDDRGRDQEQDQGAQRGVWHPGSSSQSPPLLWGRGWTCLGWGFLPCSHSGSEFMSGVRHTLSWWSRGEGLGGTRGTMGELRDQILQDNPWPWLVELWEHKTLFFIGASLAVLGESPR